MAKKESSNIGVRREEDEIPDLMSYIVVNGSISIEYGLKYIDPQGGEYLYLMTEGTRTGGVVRSVLSQSRHSLTGYLAAVRHSRIRS